VEALHAVQNAGFRGLSGQASVEWTAAQDKGYAVS